MGADQLEQKARDEVLILALEHQRLVGCAFACLREDCGFSKVAESAHAGFDRPTSITMRKSVPA